MSKKVYYSYNDLSALPEGKHKPGGTMGKHHFSIKREGDSIVITGSEKGTVLLKKETEEKNSIPKVCYTLGEVWPVKNPEDYTDPLRKVLCEKHIPQKALEESGEPVKIECRYSPSIPGASADCECGQRATYLGEVKTKIENYQEIPGDSIRIEHGYSQEEILEGGECIVVFQVLTTGNNFLAHRRSRRIERIIVRPGADRAKVAEWLKTL